MCEIKITLAAARKNAGLTQTQAANAINVSVNSLCSWETGKSNIPKAAAMALAGVYNFPVENIILPEYSTKT